MPKFELANGDVVDFEFIVNPSGAVHDVATSHPVVALARENKEGWRLASKDEIAAYREKHLIGDDEAESTELAAQKQAAEKAAAAARVAAAAPKAAAKPKAAAAAAPKRTAAARPKKASAKAAEEPKAQPAAKPEG